MGRLLAHGVWRTTVLDAGRVPRTGAVILAANHIGFFDGPVLHGVSPRPVHFMVKDEIFHGAVGAVLRAAGQIPVDTHGGRGALAAAMAVLRRGGVVGIFPEGERGRGDVAAARAGVAWLAVVSGAPVVPVTVLGTRRTGEAIGHVPGLRRPFVVAFGEPLHLSRAPGSTGRAAVADGQAQIREALAAHVSVTVQRTGVALPEDGPATAV